MSNRSDKRLYSENTHTHSDAKLTIIVEDSEEVEGGDVSLLLLRCFLFIAR